MDFKSGDAVEIMYQNGKWYPAKYIGPDPRDGYWKGRHWVVSDTYAVVQRGELEIRQPKVKKEGWMNVWDNPSRVRGGIAFASYIYATKEEATNAIYPDSKLRLDTIKVEWYE